MISILRAINGQENGGRMDVFPTYGGMVGKDPFLRLFQSCILHQSSLSIPTTIPVPVSLVESNLSLTPANPNPNQDSFNATCYIN